MFKEQNDWLVDMLDFISHGIDLKTFMQYLQKLSNLTIEKTSCIYYSWVLIAKTVLLLRQISQ